jgi:hypothetical protein
MAVIGTAGRQSDASKITRELYDAMYEETLRAIADWGVDVLVSGGAAVADHLAVRAFLDGRVGRLSLFLPAPFDGRRYVRPPRAVSDDAGTANRYHAQFSQACGLDSLRELSEAIGRGCEVTVRWGFKARNLDVAAAAERMLALTFGADEPPCDLGPSSPGFRRHAAAGLKDGGTAHTWDECWRADAKRHVSLTWLAKQLAPAAPSFR